MHIACAIVAAFLLLSAGLPAATTLKVENPVGGVHVTVATSGRLQIHGKGETRKATKQDLKITRDQNMILVRCEPADSEPIDLDVQLPLDFTLDVTTQEGPIAVAGMVRRGYLQTASGDVSISAPWGATRFRLDAEQKPPEVSTPRGFKFSRKKIHLSEGRKIWRLQDKLADWKIAYGRIRVRAAAPRVVKLTDYKIPEDSPVKFPWQAPEVLESILRAERRPSPAKPVEVSREPKPLTVTDDPVFRSDVRMVNLVVSAYDAEGHPVTGLDSDDFEVIEDGEVQDVSYAGSDDIPFNLAILLDLSGSTKPDRASMKQAAKRFISLARPHDRIAVYALAGGVFHVIARLTNEREMLLKTIERLPEVSGASPLYDTIVLAYAEDLHKRPGERNALILISDGIDNRVSKQEMPSRVRIKKLLRLAREMNALVYPIFLRSGERFGRGWSRKARKSMQRLADASGGRLFPARSIQDLEPVFPQVGEELRSVYGVAYYPQNQDFDGEWRSVKVKVKQPGVSVRARPGYFAR